MSPLHRLSAIWVVHFIWSEKFFFFPTFVPTHVASPTVSRKKKKKFVFPKKKKNYSKKKQKIKWLPHSSVCVCILFISGVRLLRKKMGTTPSSNDTSQAAWNDAILPFEEGKTVDNKQWVQDHKEILGDVRKYNGVFRIVREYHPMCGVSRARMKALDSEEKIEELASFADAVTVACVDHVPVPTETSDTELACINHTGVGGMAYISLYSTGQKRREEASVLVLRWRDLLRKMCTWRGCPQRGLVHTPVLNKCGRCLLAKYCSVTCQKADWPRHKGECGQHLSTPSSSPTPTSPTHPSET